MDCPGGVGMACACVHAVYHGPGRVLDFGLSASAFLVDLMVGGIHHISRGIIAQPRPPGVCGGVWRDSRKGGAKFAII